jgi:predicted secreted hydrolase
MSFRHVIIFTLSLFSLMPALLMGGEEWVQVLGPRTWSFPRDHGAHPEYRTEWWYFTGNLRNEARSPYGYQLTFFRQGIRQNDPPQRNAWSIRDLYLAHFAVTDVSKGKFLWQERVSRAGPGLAGAGRDRMDVWLLNWSARMEEAAIFLEAKAPEMEISLQLTPQKPPVIHGQNGFSQKGPKAGQASYYVSFTELKTQGSLKMAGSRMAVRGTSWFDQEFGSNQLSADQKGWDWFSLRLSDGKDLMIYLLRRRDGSIEPASSGTLVYSDGRSRHLPLADFRISVLNQWPSPRSGGVYPSRWKIQVPAAGMDLVFSPLVADQELHTAGSTGIIYWEGAISGKGTSGGRDVTCEGYVEMTGYAGSLGGIF